MLIKPTFPVGTKVLVKVNGARVEGEYAGWNETYNMPDVRVGDKKLPRKIWGVVGGVTVTAPTPTIGESVTSVVADVGVTAAMTGPSNVRFTVAQRFEFLSRLLNMVVEGHSKGLIVAGSGGLGKSYTVFDQLYSIGLKENDDFQIIKGFSTAKAMYRQLYDFRSGILVFDDCDSVLDHELSRNILKGALDSYDKRVISWRKDREDDTLPDKFEFQGRVVFISNKSITEFDQPLLSRTLYVDLTMSTDQKLERMEQLIDKMRPTMPRDAKMECLNLLKGVAHEAPDLNLRTLLKVFDIRNAHPNSWQDLATYAIIT